MMPFGRRPCYTRRLVAAATAVLMAVTGSAALAHNAGWLSGARNNDATTAFAHWRGTPRLGVVSGWIDWKNGWSGMYNYASGRNPRTLRSKSSNVSFGHGLFPGGGSLAACASGDYDDEQREVARRLVNNGVGDAEIRLGWEANGDWFS